MRGFCVARRLWVANSCSSGDRDLKQPAVVLPPSVVIKRRRSRGGRSGELRWRGTGERPMNAMSVVIVAELLQLPRQVHRVPEEYPIEVLTPDRSDQPFDERMRDRSVRNRLDLLDLEDAQVGEPTVEAKQGVVVGTQMPRKRLSGDDLVEHPANGRPAGVSALNAKANDPACEHVHHHQGPVELEQCCRLDEHTKLNDPARAHEQCGQPEHKAIKRCQIRCSLPGSIADQKLMFEQERLRGDSAYAARGGAA